MNKILSIFFSLFLAIPVVAFAEQSGDGGGSPTSFSGFIDLSYLSNQNEEKDSFKQDQVELDIDHAITDKVSARIDLNFTEAGEDDPATPEDESKLSTADIIEQAYIELETSTATLTFGKFNIPMGAEGGEPTEMLQFSLAMINDHGIAGDITGIMATMGGDTVEANLYVVNGNDTALKTMSDDNNEKTFGGHIGLTPAENISLGISYITGTEGTKADGKHDLSVTDIDFNWMPMEELTFVAQYNTGIYEKKSVAKPGRDEKWDGYLVKANYRFNETFGMTVRYDYFHDEGGQRLEGTVGGTAVEEKRSATTIALLATITEGLESVFEYKTTKSDKDTFEDSNKKEKDNETLFAAELVYTF